jgi:hypothetical protein
MSLLNCLCAAIPARERVITCEEVFELAMKLLLHMCEPLSISANPWIATGLVWPSPDNVMTA